MPSNTSHLRLGDHGAGVGIGIHCEYHVERVNDGRSSATGRVTVGQHGQTVALGTVGFRSPRQTWMHGDGRKPDINPDALQKGGMPHPARAIPPGAFDIRYYDERENGAFVRRMWFRAVDPLPESVFWAKSALPAGLWSRPPCRRLRYAWRRMRTPRRRERQLNQNDDQISAGIGGRGR
jgi:hypothetical protein